MDAVIVLGLVIILSLCKLRGTETVKESDNGLAVEERTLEIGTNLMLNYEPDAFELILKEFNLK